LFFTPRASSFFPLARHVPQIPPFLLSQRKNETLLHSALVQVHGQFEGIKNPEGLTAHRER
jgi:hypothetical protein